jgi:acetylornithine deacetylase/succinyl-diaminopimelate desuccinylase-like protein
MASSRSGAQASNVIPSTATASIDIRLVKGMNPAKTAERVTEFIQRQGFYVTDRVPDAKTRMAHPKIAMVLTKGDEPATRTPMDLAISQEVIRVVGSVRGPAVLLPNMGGGLPLISVERPLNTHTIVIPIANHDDNQHTFDENLRIQNLWDGIELMAALFVM